MGDSGLVQLLIDIAKINLTIWLANKLCIWILKWSGLINSRSGFRNRGCLIKRKFKSLFDLSYMDRLNEHFISQLIFSIKRLEPKISELIKYLKISCMHSDQKRTIFFFFLGFCTEEKRNLISVDPMSVCLPPCRRFNGRVRRLKFEIYNIYIYYIL